jgi:hypothetical protein
MAITQLQDVSNQIAQEGFSSNPRLRREEIRRRMGEDWTAPADDVVQPYSTNIQDTSTNYEGSDSTLASTYSKLLSNARLFGLTSGNGSISSTGTEYNKYSPNASAPLSSLPGWAPMAIGTGMSLGGLGQYAPFGAAATSLMQGNRKGAVGTMAGYIANSLSDGKIPGIGWIASSIASGLIGDKDIEDIGQDIVNSGIGTLFSAANPIAGIAYNIARNMGFNPMQGLSSMFDTRDYSSEGGHKGGFFTKPSEYTGYTPGQTYEPGTKNLSYGGYSPTMNYSNNSGGYTGYTGGSSNSYSGGDNSDGTSGYSNPSSSYGGW